jgi:N-acetylglucosaminyl-diphospho-decaprenol L-rhamnosyltransferase
MNNSSKNIKVSVIIVSMNNMKDLSVCLESIRKYTKIEYEVIVVAYLFSEQNKKCLSMYFPWVVALYSEKIRGFSENNNLALRIARGKYCFILNDDTELKMSVIDDLVRTIESLPSHVAVVSPVVLYPNGEIQFCGRPYRGVFQYLLLQFRLWNEKKVRNRYTYQQGIFKTYNIIGASFLIKKDIFYSIGFFDEYYFFCPEDIAVSSLLNQLGYECYVNSNTYIVHKEGNSGGENISRIKESTMPAGVKGNIHFYSRNNYFLYCVLVISTFISLLLLLCKHIVSFNENKNKRHIFIRASYNSIYALFHKGSPKFMFEHFYNM